MKNITAVLSALVLTILLAGCTKTYGSQDITDYVKEVCGETPKEVSREPEEVTNPADEYTDYLWTVTLKDGTVFHVLDDYHWGMEALTNTLRNDYQDVLLVNRFSSFPKTSFQLERSEEEGTINAHLVAGYTDRASLKQRLQELETIQNASEKPAYYSYRVLLDHPYRRMDHYESSEADVYGCLEDRPIDSSSAETNLLYLCLDHQYACKADFTDEEIETALDGYSHRVGFRTSETEAYDFRHPFVASSYSYGISFATLYEVLQVMGCSVDGDNKHYSFTDASGNRIEISYDFHHPLPNGREGYYYRCNDEDVNMGSYFYNHFTAYELFDKFGLDIKEFWQTANS